MRGGERHKLIKSEMKKTQILMKSRECLKSTFKTFIQAIWKIQTLKTPLETLL
jgi:hypothetical protein